MLLPLLPESEYVYIIQDASGTGFCKIGRTNNIPRRMSEFGIHLPFEVTTVRFIPTRDAVRLEQLMHSRYASKRKNGEWFALSKNDIVEVLTRNFEKEDKDAFQQQQAQTGFTLTEWVSPLCDKLFMIASNTSKHWVGVSLTDGKINIRWSYSPYPGMSDVKHTEEDYPSTIDETKIMQRMFASAIQLAEKLKASQGKVTI